MTDIFQADDILMKAVGKTTTKVEGQGLAMSILGKMRYQFVSKLYKFLAPMIKTGEEARGYVLKRHISEQLMKKTKQKLLHKRETLLKLCYLITKKKLMLFYLR